MKQDCVVTLFKERIKDSKSDVANQDTQRVRSLGGLKEDRENGVPVTE